MPHHSAPIYLDFNAGAPMRTSVRESMIEALDDTGNASSVHSHGRRARGRIETAREDVARLCGARARAVTFVSGGTEANVTALTPVWQDQGAPVYLDKLFMSAMEHPSVMTGGRFPVADQAVVPVDANGVILPEALKQVVKDAESQPDLRDGGKQRDRCHPTSGRNWCDRAEHGHFFHVDAVQAAGRMPIDLDSVASGRGDAFGT